MSKAITGVITYSLDYKEKDKKYYHNQKILQTI